MGKRREMVGDANMNKRGKGKAKGSRKGIRKRRKRKNTRRMGGKKGKGD